MCLVFQVEVKLAVTKPDMPLAVPVISLSEFVRLDTGPWLGKPRNSIDRANRRARGRGVFHSGFDVNGRLSEFSKIMIYLCILKLAFSEKSCYI